MIENPPNHDWSNQHFTKFTIRQINDWSNNIFYQKCIVCTINILTKDFIANLTLKGYFIADAT